MSRPVRREKRRRRADLFAVRRSVPEALPAGNHRHHGARIRYPAYAARFRPEREFPGANVFTRIPERADLPRKVLAVVFERGLGRAVRQ